MHLEGDLEVGTPENGTLDSMVKFRNFR
jgi:hypothetical protein